MLPLVPLTALMTTLFCLVMFGAWLYTGYRIRHTEGVVQRPVHFMHHFFLNMGLFCAFMSIPYAWLSVSAAAFSAAMAWTYVLGHIFCYLALMYIARMVVAMVPKLNHLDRIVVWVWLAFTIVITIINAKTMIWGTQPVFNVAANITEFRAAPVVGAGIALIAICSVTPAVILFGYNAAKSQGAARIKAILLLIGFLIMMVAGPLHDVARTEALYTLADVFSIISGLFLGAGVIYRLEQGLAQAPSRPIMAAPTNTI